MPIPLDIIESFFEAKLYITADLSSPARSSGTLLHFDGYAHGEVMWVKQDDALWIRAGQSVPQQPHYPLCEITVFCSNATATEAMGVGPVLLLHPMGDESREHIVCIGMQHDGRIYAEVTVGTRQTR